jgi:RimJ/RimL family protein N-acetyltransferase
MVILKQATVRQLTMLLDRSENTIDNLFVPDGEEIAPRFLLEYAIDKLRCDRENAFWLSPRLIIVDTAIVGMIGFKNLPEDDGSIEIGYGIVPSQQGRGFATKAVELLLKEAFLTTKIQTVIAHTTPSNRASHRVLEKNEFIRTGNKIDPDDGKVWIWQKSINF